MKDLDLDTIAEAVASGIRRLQEVIVLPREKKPCDMAEKVLLTALTGFTFEITVGSLDPVLCVTVEASGTVYLSVGGLEKSDQRSVVIGHLRRLDVAREAMRAAEQLLAHEVMRT